MELASAHLIIFIRIYSRPCLVPGLFGSVHTAPTYTDNMCRGPKSIWTKSNRKVYEGHVQLRMYCVFLWDFLKWKAIEIIHVFMWNLSYKVKLFGTILPKNRNIHSYTNKSNQSLKEKSHEPTQPLCHHLRMSTIVSENIWPCAMLLKTKAVVFTMHSQS